jgi:2-methylcitrate dehydratase PrpD
VPYAAASATLPLLTLWASCLDGATARNAWAGQAGASALTAHRLVDSGHRGSLRNLGDALTQLIGQQVRPLEVAPGHPRILQGYFKFHSGCALTHPAVEAALRLAPVGPADIAHVEVVVNANSMRIAALRSDNDLSRRFSVPYAVAAALVHGASGPEVFAELDPVVAAVAAKVDVREDTGYSDAWPTRSSARVTVTDAGGATGSAECLNPVGSPGDVGAEDGLPLKFARCTGAPTGAWARLASAPSQTTIGDWLSEVVSEAASDPGPERARPSAGDSRHDRTATRGLR